VAAKNQSLRPSFLAVQVHNGRACIQVLEMALSSGFGNRTKEREIRTSVLRTAAHIEVVMVRDFVSIVGMVNHRDMKKATATSTSWVVVKRRDI
jgi:hypothetical protein